MTATIDTHLHFWNLDLVEYSWLTPELGPLYRTYGPHEAAPQLTAAGVDGAVLIQAANSYADTNYLLAQADRFDWIAAVIGWVPLDNPREARHMLDSKYSKHPRFRGVRHLIHDEQDTEWLRRPLVLEGLRLLADRGLVFEVVAVYPDHLPLLPSLAEQLPTLTFIIDHLAKPPIKAGEADDWSAQMAAAARYPNIYAKVSGLNTAADWATWTAADLQPYVDETRRHFGAERMLLGSDWPVARLAGEYNTVWGALRETIAGYPPAEQAAILGGNARRVYRLAGGQE